MEREPADLFENSQTAHAIIPTYVWMMLRILVLAAFLLLIVLVIVRPELGRTTFWHLTVPLLPLIFVVAPGVWRNVCPLGFANQLPRILGFSAKRTLPNWSRERAFLFATIIFLGLILGRKPLLNDDSVALAAMLGGAFLLAFVGGIIFKGKSGWCGTFCPLAPVQTAYGHAPLTLVHDRYCRPCVGCQKNCYDFNPRAKVFSDFSDSSEEYKGDRKIFIGMLPGLIWAYFQGPAFVAADIWTYVAGMLYPPLLSIAIFQLVQHVFALNPIRAAQLFSLGALVLFYWFAVPTFLSGLGTVWTALSKGELWQTAGLAVAQAGALIAVGCCVIASFVIGLWFHKAYLARSAESSATNISGGAGGLQRRLLDKESSVRVFERSTKSQLAVPPGQPVLEALESAKLPIQAGCRLGMCGADPLLIVDGHHHLGTPTETEAETLRRLGLQGKARLACMCRPTGPITVDLDISRAQEIASTTGDEPVRPSPSGPRYLVVGNGAAGVTFIEHLRVALPDARIGLVGREPHHFYNRMGIEKVIYGRSVMSGLYLADDRWFEGRGVELWLNTLAAQIDRSSRQLVLATGERLPYDKLVLATGARPVIPSIPGRHLTGVFMLREADDAIRLRSYIQVERCRNAVVLGGGVLGIEAADALHRAGLSVSIVHKGDTLMDKQLDTEAAGLLMAHLVRKGIAVIPKRSVAMLSGNDAVTAAILDDGRNLPCELFLACIGVTPNSELAQEAGLRTERGVLVDATFTTSDTDILCIGDAAESDVGPSGLWATAVTHAKIAVAHLAGQATLAPTRATPVRLKLHGIDVRSAGQLNAGSDTSDEFTGSDEEANIWRRLVLREGAIVGFVFVNDATSAQAAFELMTDAVSVGKISTALRRNDWTALVRLARDHKQAKADNSCA